ncbi:thiamine phosphate synthase [Teredinibacter purpureus]|uniref:thiamine phosphate synthase n=1 Tax=Teredinibacter purpureus TaxID=2731756 RepID=UPI0005F86C6A|nr:thiamine phosphate synthase [Teredinibacter purpureus]
MSKTLSSTAKAPVIWAIGGSDSRAGAGVQADLLTANDLGVACCTIITAVTAQNTKRVSGVYAVSANELIAQLDTLAEDSLPCCIKIGLIATQAQVQALAQWLIQHRLRQHRLPQYSLPLIIDPVQIASNHDSLTCDPVDLSPLLPLCTLITPNSGELESLGGLAALAQHAVNAILLTGEEHNGTHLLDQFYDVKNDRNLIWHHPKISSLNTHGTGCTLAAAIAAGLALNFPLEDAITQAIAYVRSGLRPTAIAHQNGAVAHHGWPHDGDDWPTGKIVGAQSRSTIEQASPIDFLPMTNSLGFYPVVDSVTLLEQLMRLGVRTLQLRLKDIANLQQLRTEIHFAIQLAKHYNAQLFINDHWQIACELGAYGVHLGQGDICTAALPEIARANLRLGISTHGFFELSIARGYRPSYVALGHVFPTTTKKMPSQPQGLKRLAQTAQLTAHTPTVAIGGIDLSNAAKVLACGVNSVAVVRAVTQSQNLAFTVQQFLSIFDRMNVDANIDRERLHAAVS